MRAFLRVADALSAAAGALAAASLALLAIIVLAEVASVWLLNRSITFAWEYGGFLMAFTFFLGLGWTLNSGGHVRVSLVRDYLPPAVERWVDVAATGVALLIASFLTSALTGLAWSSWVDGSRTFTATATPLVIPQGVVALGAAILALQLLARLVRLLRREQPDTAPAPTQDALGEA